MTITLPPFLQQGDTIGLIAMASKVRYDDLSVFKKIVTEKWGLKINEGQTLTNSYFQFSGTDEERIRDFQSQLDNPEIKAIFSARGGYGSSRIIDKLNFRKFRKNPKWVVGFSDITAVQCHLHRLKFGSIHSIVAKQFQNEGYQTAVDSLENIMFGQKFEYITEPHQQNRTGKATGQLVGGNLCLLAHLIGSRSELDTRNKILFIEDVGEALYNLDRMIVQLKRAKKLEKLAGLVVGQFTETKDNEQSPFGKTAYEIIASHVSDYDFPIVYNFPIGHDERNVAVVVGSEVSLEVTNQNAILRQL